VAVISGAGYPINNALSPPATGCDIIVLSEPEFRRRESFGKSGDLHKDDKKSLCNNGLFIHVITPH
jgi:hypothetical protein